MGCQEEYQVIWCFIGITPEDSGQCWTWSSVFILTTGELCDLPSPRTPPSPQQRSQKNGLKKKKKREKSSDIPHHEEMTKWMYDGYNNTLEEKNMLVCCSREEKSKIQVKTNAIKACFFRLEIEGFSIAKCYFSKESI